MLSMRRMRLGRGGDAWEDQVDLVHAYGGDMRKIIQRSVLEAGAIANHEQRLTLELVLQGFQFIPLVSCIEQQAVGSLSRGFCPSKEMSQHPVFL